MYRVTFTLEQKVHTIRAKTVTTDYPMIVVKDIIWSTGSPLILAPEDPTRKRFEDAKELAIPFHSVQLIEEISERKAQIRELPGPGEAAPEDNSRKPTAREFLVRHPIKPVDPPPKDGGESQGKEN